MNITKENYKEKVAQSKLNLEVGDIVFTHIPFPPFCNISEATETFANHVGVVTGFDGDKIIVSESRVPFSTTTTLDAFIKRSKNFKFEVYRVKRSLTEAEKAIVTKSASEKQNILYNTTYDINRRGSFCSKFVRDVLFEATGEEIGKIEDLQQILNANPKASLTFWKIWFFGRIPWARRTVTPKSLIVDEKLEKVAG